MHTKYSTKGMIVFLMSTYFYCEFCTRIIISLIAKIFKDIEYLDIEF